MLRRNDKAQLDVSVIMPVWGVWRYLSASITGVLSQVDCSLELLLVIDGSQPPVEEAVAKISDSRLRVLKHDFNRGVSTSRNLGMKSAVGRYVAFCDADDVWCERNKLKEQLQKLERGGLRGTYTQAKVVDGSNLQVGYRYSAPVVNRDTLRVKNDVVLSSLLIENTADVWFKNVRHEDYVFLWDFLEKGRLELTETTLVSYRVHGGNTTKNKLRSLCWHVNVQRSEFGLSLVAIASGLTARCLRELRDRVRYHSR